MPNPMSINVRRELYCKFCVEFKRDRIVDDRFGMYHTAFNVPVARDFRNEEPVVKTAVHRDGGNILRCYRSLNDEFEKLDLIETPSAC